VGISLAIDIDTVTLWLRKQSSRNKQREKCYGQVGVDSVILTVRRLADSLEKGDKFPVISLLFPDIFSPDLSGTSA